MSILALARALCPDDDDLITEVERAKPDEAGRTLLDGLIARGRAALFGERQDADAVLDRVFALRRVPSGAPIPAGAVQPVANERTTVRDALALAHDPLWSLGVILTTVDTYGDGFPTIAIDADAFPAIVALAADVDVEFVRTSEPMSSTPPPPPSPPTARRMTPAEKTVTRALKDLDTQAAEDWQTRLRELEEESRWHADGETPANELLLDLATLGTFAGRWIQACLIEETGHPWYEAERFQAYSALWFAYDDPDDVGPADRFGLSLYCALAWGREDRVRRLGELGLRRIHEGRMHWATTAANHPSSMFALWLAARVLDKEDEVPLSGPFAALAATWNDAVTLDTIADYHLASVARTSEFHECYDLMPVELDAIRRVREREGLATVWPDTHPLVTNPIAQAYLARTTGNFVARNDELFQHAVEALEREGRVSPALDPWTV